MPDYTNTIKNPSCDIIYFMKNLRNKKRVIIMIVVVLVLGVLGFKFFGNKKEIKYDTIIAENGDYTQKINSTGKIEAVLNIDLSFEKTGRVTRVYKDVGDNVYQGEVLVSLSGSEESAQLAQAQARLVKNQLKLTELEKGIRSEEIQVQGVKIKNAEIEVENAKRNLVDVLQDSYTKADDAVRNKTDSFFVNPKIASSRLIPSIFNSQSNGDMGWERFLIEKTLEEWGLSLGQLNTESNLTLERIQTNKKLNQIKNFLDNLSLIVNSLSPNSDLSQTSIDTYKLNVSTSRTNINTAITNISSGLQRLENTTANLALLKQELILKESGATIEQIAFQEAQIREDQANIQYYEAQLAKLYIRSPINGVVTTQNAKVGGLVSMNVPVVTVMSRDKYQVEAFVVEADIANLKMGNNATLSLDAYDEDLILEAVVVKIDPAAGYIDGVANYKVTLQLKEKNDKLRSGMTADIDIITAKREKIIAIPERAIIFKDNLKFIRILNENKEIVEVKIETGISLDRGYIEILSGVNEGDVIVTSIKN